MTDSFRERVAEELLRQIKACDDDDSKPAETSEVLRTVARLIDVLNDRDEEPLPSKWERLTVVLLLKLLAKLDADNLPFNPELLINYATSGFADTIEKIYREVDIDDMVSRKVCRETGNILNLFRYLEDAVTDCKDDLTEEEVSDLTFFGFDASESSHYDYAEWIFEETDWYDSLSICKQPDRASHMLVLDRYLRMYDAWVRVRRPQKSQIDILKAIAAAANS